MNFAPIDNKQLIETSSLIKLIANTGRILKAYDVANKGIYSVPKELKNKAINASYVNISSKEYKRILKEYE